jgi:saccharopine dehydrogenase-like NADP-dependent oxidoreductase
MKLKMIRSMLSPCRRQLGTHMVTASYVSPEMKELHEQAKAKGVVLLNEMGLDPGMDHMSAMQVIDEVRKKSLR